MLLFVCIHEYESGALYSEISPKFIGKKILEIEYIRRNNSYCLFVFLCVKFYKELFNFENLISNLEMN